MVCATNGYLKEKDETFQIGKRYDNEDFHLAIGGGLCLGKWLKSWAGQGII